MTGFAELVAATNYSFLRGASHPSDMVGQAIDLGYAGIGIADRNTVAGVVRAWAALREKNEEARHLFGHGVDLKLIVGARLVFSDGTPDIVAYPANRRGWGHLCRMLTQGNRRAAKGDCLLTLADLVEYGDDLLLIAMADDADEDVLRRLLWRARGSLWLGATMPCNGDDRRRLKRQEALADRLGIPLIATNDALYAEAGDRPLQDVVTCIRAGVTVRQAGRRLLANAERHLKSPDEMARLFRDAPAAIAETLAFLARVEFDLSQLQYEYPHEPVPEGWEPQEWLEHLVRTKLPERYPDGLTAAGEHKLQTEFDLIRAKNYAYYFLTVHDVVAHACKEGILCQGRGSAANSIVCYVLGVTAIDPIKEKLLFTRFLSEERDEPPDIDVDFEHERREIVMQYIYDRYGRDRAGIAATVIHYRPRSAVREVAKALGISEDVVQRLTGTVWGSFSGSMEPERYQQAGIDPGNSEIVRLRALVDRLLNFPRHLSQHVGGFVLTEGRLDEMVPIHNAAMPDRTFIEWDKDDIDALGLMKVDILALGMLTCIRKAFSLLREWGAGDYALHTIPQDDPDTYAMLQKGDSIGVFQVESRAQINMLPRLKPKELYDLVIQVAIVRPGPIEGDMVHPYLRRRAGKEKVEWPSPNPPHDPNELREVLGKTLGVPLFQEQAMNLAITAAEFSNADANRLRHSMATFRNVGKMERFEEKLVEGMVRRGYARDFAERCFKQIEGFGSYGFPESHAQSFAILVYASSWIKCHHPAIFACAILNSQPMGFYAPAQLVRDAREHDVDVRPIDVNCSGWDHSIERADDGVLALRLGFRLIGGFREEWAASIAAAREAKPFASIEQLARAARLPSRALRLLADADALQSFGMGRRDALWEVRRTPKGSLPLFDHADARELGEEPDAHLPALEAWEEVTTDYQTTRLSLNGHPMQFLRPLFRAEGVLSCQEIGGARNGRIVRTAGVVLVRQRPGKGNAIFVTLEDESGIANVLIWARLFESFRREVMAARLMLVEGEVQRSEEGVVHLMARRIVDRTSELNGLMLENTLKPPPPGSPDPRSAASLGGHPRNVRIVPPSRDFH
ncbi:error-prone DNA polymerase [Allosphingosinicella indica]|uniref:Error-prone DNA polymerase n=1 Tax=Allosphingosinicella indica TaxID=941907 RepID=A0A1X7GHM4_9SPHN|nr:error-prone DNA polymerase [Allosphingosinicella indica]SMF69900.1 error-prone DNA polymerase, DnaE-like [Allosphingosinicella indica]